VWSRRIFRAGLAIALAVLLARRLTPRPAFLPLAVQVDGPPPAEAAGVVVFLHGKPGDLATAELMARALRGEGLPGDVAIVLVEGPYHTWFAHQWGDTAAEQASARRRLRERLRELLGDRGPPPARVVIAGFSQGAGVALDTAVEEPHIGRVASFSPCRSRLETRLPERGDLRVLLAHGSSDPVCPVEVSRSLARLLAQAHRQVQYLEFEGPHTVPLAAVRALARFATSP